MCAAAFSVLMCTTVSLAIVLVVETTPSGMAGNRVTPVHAQTSAGIHKSPHAGRGNTRVCLEACEVNRTRRGCPSCAPATISAS